MIAANHFTVVPFTADMIRHMNRLAGDDKASTAIDAPYYIHGRRLTCAEDIPNTPPPPASNSREPAPVPHIESPLPDRDLDTDHADTQEQDEQPPPHERPL